MCNDTNAVTIPEENMKPEPWYAPLRQLRCNATEAEALRERLIVLGMLGLTKQAAMESTLPCPYDPMSGGTRSFLESDFVSGQF